MLLWYAVSEVGKEGESRANCNRGFPFSWGIRRELERKVEGHKKQVATSEATPDGSLYKAKCYNISHTVEVSKLEVGVGYIGFLTCLITWQMSLTPFKLWC